MTLVDFVAVATPAGMGSGRGVPVRRKDGRMGIAVTVASTRTRPFQAAVAAAAAEHHVGELVRGPVSVELHFAFARPAAHYGTGRNAGQLKLHAPTAPANRASGDLDKLCRAVLDALEGTILADDAQVVDLRALKLYDTPERVHVVVTSLNGAP